MPTIKTKVIEVFEDRIGEVFLRNEIIDLVVNRYPGTNRSSVIPSDYRYNVVNVGIDFDFHLFESLGEGRYDAWDLIIHTQAILIGDQSTNHR